MPYKDPERQKIAKRAWQKRWSKTHDGKDYLREFARSAYAKKMAARDEARRAEFAEKGWIWDEDLYRSKGETANVTAADLRSRRRMVERVKGQLGCAVCGLPDGRVLYFQGHRIAQRVAKVSGYRLLLIIAAAGRPKCANCLRKENEPAQEAKLRLEALKSERGCLYCGEKNGRCLDYHHRDRSSKKAEVSKLARGKKLKNALAEAEKCDVVCANCHIIHHRDEKEMFEK